MSLKAFHLIFLISAVILTLGFGAYSIINYMNGSSFAFLAMGIFSSILGVALCVYGRFFLRKLRHISFL
jgi:hypothetical protein